MSCKIRVTVFLCVMLNEEKFWYSTQATVAKIQ